MNEVPIYNWLIMISGYNAQNVIRANQGGPVPCGDFLTWQITSITQDIMPANVTGNISDTYDVTLNFVKEGEFTIDINVYASNGVDILNNLIQSSSNRSVYLLLKAAYYGIKRVGGIQDLSSLQETKTVPRYMCEFVIGYTHVYSYKETNYLWEKFEVTGEDSPDGNEILIKG